LTFDWRRYRLTVTTGAISITTIESSFTRPDF
jgi:hypothetical protein